MITPDESPGGSIPGARTAPSTRFGRSRSILEASALGLVLGFLDSQNAGSGGFVFPAYFAAGVLIGVRHAGKTCLCWPFLGVSLYVVHVVAIALGARPPFVEENYRFAEQCLWAFVPSGIGLLAGVGLRAFLFACDRLRRGTGPPVKFLPKTTRDVMVVVACLAVGLGALHRVMFPPTVYAAWYSEGRFQAITRGMTAEQVVTALGQPLNRRVSPDGTETWEYSAQYTYTSDYERRWVILSNGVVRDVVSDYWFD